MIAYADTAFLCSLYTLDAKTPQAAARMTVQILPLPVIWLHQIEFRNALRLRVFRKEASSSESAESLRGFLADLNCGVLVNARPDMDRLTVEAERLSAMYTEVIGSRSLDVIHVAAALLLGAAEFLTFDKRQAYLAKAVGLKVPELS